MSVIIFFALLIAVSLVVIRIVKSSTGGKSEENQYGTRLSEALCANGVSILRAQSPSFKESNNYGVGTADGFPIEYYFHLQDSTKKNRFKLTSDLTMNLIQHIKLTLPFETKLDIAMRPKGLVGVIGSLTLPELNAPALNGRAVLFGTPDPEAQKFADSAATIFDSIANNYVLLFIKGNTITAQLEIDYDVEVEAAVNPQTVANELIRNCAALARLITC